MWRAPLLVAASASNVHDEARAELAARINAIPGITWTAGAVDRFRGTPLGSSKDMLGVKEDQAEVFAKAIEDGELEVVTGSAINAPESFDSAENWPQCAKTINDIRDQSNCGCCWAFGAASAASDRLCIWSNAKFLVPLSANDMCFCANSNGCGGGYVNKAWDYIGKTGLVTGGQRQDDLKDHVTDLFEGEKFCSAFPLPHCHHHGEPGGRAPDPYPDETDPACPTQSSPKCPTQCDAGAKAEHSKFMSDKHVFKGRTQQYSGEAAMQQAVMEGGPIEVAFTVYDDFEVYSKGIYQHKTGSQLGGHAVKLVGWGVENGVKYWKIANSWNPYWGENGYFRIIRGQNDCGIESQTGGNSVAEGWCKVEGKSCAGQTTGSACSVCDGEVLGVCANDGSCCSKDAICGGDCCPDDVFGRPGQCCRSKTKQDVGTCMTSFHQDTCCDEGNLCSTMDTCCGGSCCKFMREKCVDGQCVSSFMDEMV